MRGVIWLLLLFVVAVVAASTLGRNDGLVSLYWSGWRLDVSLNLFVIALVGACIVLMLAIRAVQSLLSLPERAQRWRTEQRERAGQEALRESLVEFFGARYSRAHKAAQRAVAIQESSPALLLDRQSRVLGLLLSGASLHRMQDRVQRDQQLARLGGVAALARRNTDDAVQLQAAEWALDDRDAPRALALLAELPAGVARRMQALRLSCRPSAWNANRSRRCARRACWPSTRRSRVARRTACCARWRSRPSKRRVMPSSCNVCGSSSTAQTGTTHTLPPAQQRAVRATATAQPRATCCSRSGIARPR